VGEGEEEERVVEEERGEERRRRKGSGVGRGRLLGVSRRGEEG